MNRIELNRLCIVTDLIFLYCEQEQMASFGQTEIINEYAHCMVGFAHVHEGQNYPQSIFWNLRL